MRARNLKFTPWLAGLVWVCSFAAGAKATPVTFEFQGRITQVAGDSYGLAAGWGAVGDPFWGYFSYDPVWRNTAGGYVSGNSQYYYYYSSFGDPAEAMMVLSVSTRSQSQVIDGDMGLNVASVSDAVGNDQFHLGGEYGHGFYVNIGLIDPTGAAISSTSLPSDFNLADWSGHELLLNGFPEEAFVRGEITALSKVPEAGATAGLLSLAAVFLAAVRRWKPGQ